MDHHDTLTRREAMQIGAITAGIAPLLAASSGPGHALPIIDTHVHLWDLKTFRLAWIDRGSALDRSFLPADYAAATEGLNVVKAVYLEVDVDPAQQVLEAETVVALCRRRDSPLAAAVISGRPADPGFAAYIKALAVHPEIKGVRQVLHGGTPPGYCLSEAFIRGIRLLGDLGLSFDLCLREGDLGDGTKLIEACPETPFILDHCGNPTIFGAELGPWKRAIDAMARRPNVSCKVSGIVASAKGRPWKPSDLAPVVDHVLDAFGPDRVLFGGDWPVCTLGSPLAGWVRALSEIVAHRPEAARRKLFHDNAVRVYRLGS
ncbi:amidohydrolase family protein [Aquisphaera insulae]|uniref:amidohydrolase family protein n=1 Tax=Aquisphaera insulae TaxID=2712864 RepID=UPI0013EA3620|nr:amidohydrolase family protein [Aquisphaera insulae]